MQTPSINSPVVLQTPTKTQKPEIQASPPSIIELTRLYEMGVLSKTEVRAIVLKTFEADKQLLSPAPSPKQTPAKKKNFVRVKRKLAPTPCDVEREVDEAVLDDSPALKRVKKERPGRPTIQISTLRTIVKNMTRRRFFNQCIDPKSLLWQESASGANTFQSLLFARAAQKVTDMLYLNNPGALHKVTLPELLKIIKWQVCGVCVCAC